MATLVKKEYEKGTRWFINNASCTILNCSKPNEIILWEKDLTEFVEECNLKGITDPEEVKELFTHSKGDDIPRTIARPGYETVSKRRNEFKSVLDLYKDDATRETFYLKICNSPYEALVHATKTYHNIVENDLTELKVIRKKRGTNEYTTNNRQISEQSLIILERQKKLAESQKDLEDELIKLEKKLSEKECIIEEMEQVIEYYRIKAHVDFCTCPDCGSECVRLYSNKTGKYFVGCISGHHTVKPYGKLAQWCYEEGFLRDLWEETQ